MKMRRQHRRQHGFTMVELMISLALVAIVIGLMMQIAVVMLSGFKEQREALELSRNARAASELLSEAVRNASAGVTTGDVRDSTGCNDVVGIKVTNHDDEPDEIEIIYASGGIVTSARADVSTATTTFPVVDATGIIAGDKIIITSGTEGRLLPVVAVGNPGVTTDITTNTNLCGGSQAMTTFAGGALVIRARYAKLAVEVGPDGIPMLTVDPDGIGPEESEILAEGIEDIQIAVGVDLDGDSAILDLGDTTDEWFYNAPGDTDPPSITLGQWRAIRVTVTAQDLRNRGSSARAAAEDRPAGSLDSHRRRTLRTQIEIRNLGRAF
jgi:prepilin-type N-terminal cleavage/methylation domain-containing protein